MRKSARNVGASVRARLLRISKDRNQTFDVVLTRYVAERLLDRLTHTPYGDQFVLKGAMLISTWFADAYRPTRDIDLLGYGSPEPTAMLKAFGDVCAVPADDGVLFDLPSLGVEALRADLKYGGLALRAWAAVGGARVRVAVDVGFGDATEPGLLEPDILVLLNDPPFNFPPLRLRTYARETVMAEKFHAMVVRGRINTRLKDYYDVWRWVRTSPAVGDRLARAFGATFARRDTVLPSDLPIALTPVFTSDPIKRQQWMAFCDNVAMPPGPLDAVVEEIASFLMPHALRARELARGHAP